MNVLPRSELRNIAVVAVVLALAPLPQADHEDALCTRLGGMRE